MGKGEIKMIYSLAKFLEVWGNEKAPKNSGLNQENKKN
jgi:hypothetical protein